MVKRGLLIILMLLCHAPLWAAGQGKISDPLRPLNYAGRQEPSRVQKAAEQEPQWRLGAVLISADRAVAVINGESLQVGESISGFKVIKIDPASVQLQKKQKKLTLRRSGTGLKKAFSSQDVEEGSKP